MHKYVRIKLYFLRRSSRFYISKSKTRGKIGQPRFSWKTRIKMEMMMMVVWTFAIVFVCSLSVWSCVNK